MFYIENDVELGLLSLPSKSLEEKRDGSESRPSSKKLSTK